MTTDIFGGDRVRDYPPIERSNLADLLARLAGKQPLDSDLTAIAALSTTEFGRALLTHADAGAVRGVLNVWSKAEGETPAGAQAKATAALDSAKDYTDIEVDAAVKAGAVNPRDDWDAGVAYAALDLVYHSGQSWYAKEATVAGEEPGVSTKWGGYAQGLNEASARGLFPAKSVLPINLRDHLPAGWVNGDLASDALDAAIAAAKARGQASSKNRPDIYVPAGTYGIDRRHIIPGGIGILGDGDGQGQVSTLFMCTTATACLAFGERVTDHGYGGISQNWTVDGNAIAVNPWYVGLTVHRTFIAIESLRATGQNFLMEVGQNNTFIACNMQMGSGDACVLDYGAGGNLFLRSEIADQGGRGLVFRQLGFTGVGYADGPTHNTFVHPIIERGFSEGVVVEKGALNTLVTPVIQIDSTATPLKMVVAGGGGTLFISGGNVQPGAVGTGTAFTVQDNSVLILSGSPSVTNAQYVFDIVAGKVNIDGWVRQNNVTSYATATSSQDTNIRSDHVSPIRVLRQATTDRAIYSQVTGETFQRWQAAANGTQQWGDGTVAPDVALLRQTADVLSMGVGDSFRVEGLWNGGMLRVGPWYLWDDGTAHLRAKRSAPASATDGAILNVTMLEGSVTVDPPSIAAGAVHDFTITVTGAAVADHVTVTPNSLLSAPAGLTFYGVVSAANTVTVRITNNTAAAIDPPNAVWRAAVMRFA